MGEDKSREDVIAVSRSDSSLRAGVFPYLCGACRGVSVDLGRLARGGKILGLEPLMQERQTNTLLRRLDAPGSGPRSMRRRSRS